MLSLTLIKLTSPHCANPNKLRINQPLSVLLLSSSPLTDMSINSSYSSSTASAIEFGNCQISVLNRAVFTAFFVSYSLFLPLFIFVLWQLGHRRSAAVETKDADVFTFHIVLLQIVGAVGGAVAVNWGLRQSFGVRIRNISIGCVWLLCFTIICVCLDQLANVVLTFLMLVSALVAITFCSISVLFVLIRPRPGEVGGTSEKVNRAKQKAFYTILLIMMTLIIRFLSYLVYAFLCVLLPIKNDDPCLLSWSVNWFSLPNALVLPLLFLQRVGKLPRCGHISIGLIRKLQHILCC